MEDIKRILVISRMSKCCRKAVHYGVSLARQYRAELFVMHVIHNPFGLEGWNLPMVSLAEEYRKDLAKTKKELDELVKKETTDGLAIKELIREGEPTQVILETIAREKIDLLILAAHEEGRLESFLFGLSNEEIVRKMPCSLLLVKEQLPVVRF